MTKKEACEKALAVQNGCNPRGIARLLVEVVDRACAESTDGAKNDPAVYLVMDKLASLGLYPQSFGIEFSRHYDDCEKASNVEV